MDPKINVNSLTSELTCAPVHHGVEELARVGPRQHIDTLFIEVKQERVDGSDIDEDDIKYDVGEGIHNKNIEQVQNIPSLYVKKLTPEATCTPIKIEEVQIEQSNTLVIEVKQEKEDASDIDGCDIKYDVAEGIHNTNIAQVQNNHGLNVKSSTTEATSTPLQIKELAKPVLRQHIDPLVIKVKQEVEEGSDIDVDINYDVAEGIHRGKVNSFDKFRDCAIVPINNLDLVYICDCCSSKFTSKELLLQHIAEHVNTFNKANNKVFKQDKDSTDSSKPQNEIHPFERSYEYKVCDIEINDKRRLHRQQKIHTSESYECAVCKKSFHRKVHLNQHRIIHTGDKPHHCSVCKKRFNKKSNLNSHLKIHIGEKSYQCSVCDKRFRRKADLDKHINIHTGHKPYQCSVCEKRFNQKVHLDQHLIIHTGDKPYQCSVCNKRFNKKGNLNIHLKIHVGEKSNKCLVCDKRFRSKSDLNKHQNIHTGHKPYQCTVCDKRFSGKSYFNKHLKRHT